MTQPGGYQYSQGRSRILSATFTAPAAASNTAVHAAVTDDGTEQTITSGITNPDVARNVTATAGGTAADIKAIQVVVEGTDTFGEAISETLPAFTVDTAGSVTGSKAFATITSITIPAHDGTGATTSIGVGKALGLPAALSRNTVVAVFRDNSKDTGSFTVAVDADEVASNTVTPSASFVPNGDDIIVDYYK